MKTILSVLCSVMVLTFCFTVTTRAASNENLFAIDAKADASLATGDNHEEEISIEKAIATPATEKPQTAAQNWFQLGKKGCNFVASYLPARATTVSIPKAAPVASTKSRFSKMAEKQYLITASVIAASAATSYYCSGDTCSGIAGALTSATPGMVTYFALSTGIAYFL